MIEVPEVAHLDQVPHLGRIAEIVTWADGQPPADLCAITTSYGLGCLALSERPNMATVDKTGIRSVLAFVDIGSGDATLAVPRDRDSLEDLTGRDPSLQHPYVAKGLGILGGTEPGSLTSHYGFDTVAALREVPVRGAADVLVDPLITAGGGILRHAGRLITARFFAEHETDDEADGVQEFIDQRAAELGGRACVLMPLSPVNEMVQRAFRMRGTNMRGHVLINGLARPALSPLVSVGTAPVPQIPNWAKNVLKRVP